MSVGRGDATTGDFVHEPSESIKDHVRDDPRDETICYGISERHYGQCHKCRNGITEV